MQRVILGKMAAAAASTRATVPTVAKARGKKLERPNLEEYRSKISAERRAVADLFKRMVRAYIWAFRS